MTGFIITCMERLHDTELTQELHAAPTASNEMNDETCTADHTEHLKGFGTI